MPKKPKLALYARRARALEADLDRPASVEAQAELMAERTATEAGYAEAGAQLAAYRHAQLVAESDRGQR
jgi:hypothetical protein